VARQNSDLLLNHGNEAASLHPVEEKRCSLVQAYDPFLMSKRPKSHIFGNFDSQPGRTGQRTQ
jgi:hypothetical protein